MKDVAGNRGGAPVPHSPSRSAGFRRPRRRVGPEHRNTSDGILIVDSNGRILFANAIAGRMFGRHPDDLLRTVFDPPITSGAGTEIAVHRPGQGEVAIELHISETVWGGLPAMLVRLQDASRRKAQEARKRRARKLEATGRLAASVAHDFNNLVAVLESGLRVLRRHLGDAVDATAATLIEEMLGRTHNGAALAERLLSFAKGQSSDTETVNASERIASLADLLRQTLGKGIEVKTTFDPEVKDLQIDGDQLDIAILNLAINARDAMAGKGILSIVTASDSQQLMDEKDVATPFVRISVTDTGCGMTDDIRTLVMEPFFTTKGPEHGTGLGLSQVHDFARQSGGHVRIESQTGVGTTVHLFLPVPSRETPSD